ncbi:MAG: hypothetical protein Q8K30_02240 [Candidatus Gracilibacteria bacterium]|nr:hypothetical protein [Candidatus Gracilibacteria bacterium]
MGLEDYSPEIESSQGLGQSAEASKESSEKYKESTKKAGAKVAKVGKDEKKAKKYDFLLAGFLVKIIVDKKYDSILDNLFASIHLGYASNFVLGILSLINIEISHEIRSTSNKKDIIFDYEKSSEANEFDDSNINSKIKDRINYWIEDIIDSVTIEYSSLQTEKIKELIKTDETVLQAYTSKIFTFFLNEINISIKAEQSDNISQFIISEISKYIDKLEVEEI